MLPIPCAYFNKCISLHILLLFIVCSGKCDFAPRWGAGQWIVQNVFTNNNTISMLIYSRDSAHMIYSNNPETEISKYPFCNSNTSLILLLHN